MSIGWIILFMMFLVYGLYYEYRLNQYNAQISQDTKDKEIDYTDKKNMDQYIKMVVEEEEENEKYNEKQFNTLTSLNKSIIDGLILGLLFGLVNGNVFKTSLSIGLINATIFAIKYIAF
jgi:F0F1-type ATP synthase assembly protein I